MFFESLNTPQENIIMIAVTETRHSSSCSARAPNNNNDDFRAEDRNGIEHNNLVGITMYNALFVHSLSAYMYVYFTLAYCL